MPELEINTDLLRAQGLEISNPAIMLQFYSAEAFRQQSNNFPRYFNCRAVGERVASLIEGRQVLKRFALLQPIQTSSLQEITSQPGWYNNHQTWGMLFQSYGIMSHLVDRSDENVVRDNQADGYYLVR